MKRVKCLLLAALAAMSGCAGVSVNSPVIPSAEEGYFPSVTLADLAGSEHRLPAELPTPHSLIVLGFAHEQRGDMDAWVRAASEEAGTSQRVSVLRIPVIDSSSLPLRAIIRAGMQSKIEEDARRRVMPLFADRAAFLAAIGSDGSDVEVMLTGRSGAVYWRSRGKPNDRSLAELRHHISLIDEHRE